jgi:hypothetical protein
MANVGSRAPACPPFYYGAAQERAHCHTRQAPPIRARIGSVSRSGDHIPNTYLQIHIYKGELHTSPEQLGGFDLLEEALESILQMTQDLRWKLLSIIKFVGRNEN